MFIFLIFTPIYFVKVKLKKKFYKVCVRKICDSIIFNLTLTKFFSTIFCTILQVSGQDILMSTKEEEWGNALCLRDSVVLRDRLMTDAALGGPRPIKSEHSYSLLAASPPPSPATPGANPYTPNSGSSSEAVGSTTTNTNSTIDFPNLDHKSLGKIMSRVSVSIATITITVPIMVTEWLSVPILVRSESLVSTETRGF